MEERLLKLLTSRQLSATRFAEIIGVQKSSISHILSGRNKPSFDFIEKVLTKFPEVSSEWLILGKGSMYRQTVQASLFDTPMEPPMPVEDESDNDSTKVSNIQSTSPANGNQYPPENALNVKKITRVLIFYKDRTFSEYFPE